MNVKFETSENNNLIFLESFFFSKLISYLRILNVHVAALKVTRAYRGYSIRFCTETLLKLWKQCIFPLLASCCYQGRLGLLAFVRYQKGSSEFKTSWTEDSNSTTYKLNCYEKCSNNTHHNDAVALCYTEKSPRLQQFEDRLQYLFSN